MRPGSDRDTLLNMSTYQVAHLPYTNLASSGFAQSSADTVQRFQALEAHLAESHLPFPLTSLVPTCTTIPSVLTRPQLYGAALQTSDRAAELYPLPLP
jgi:hypothetical protein